jgi:UDP-N-acetylmuramoyl-L-alanyl-D-glutamate--2,6-diaminopimelate ligase
MKLSSLISVLETTGIAGETDREISGVRFDSREVSGNSLFVAIKGTGTDGHRYIPEAVKAGAVAIVCEDLPDTPANEVTWIQVRDSRIALALLAAQWYGHPSREIRLAGVTGTNGKTTVATLLYTVHTDLGYTAGLLSTIEVRIGGSRLPATHTTPDPLQINRYLRMMVDQGCEFCFMEVSSHAASQHRIHGLEFDLGIFTNITHDHLDYHADFDAYLGAKKHFFDQLPGKSTALVNADDRHSGIMTQNTAAHVVRFGMSRLVEYTCRVSEMHMEGMQMELNGNGIWVRLTGKFNALNLLAVYASAMVLGQPEEQLLEALSRQQPVHGRFETLPGREGRMAIVDYAHTDDALKNVLMTIREITRGEKGIITVVGTGGDRDRTKRPKMARVAVELSTRVIFTSDNPRTEDPEKIMDDMEKGIPEDRQGDLLRITNREEAIKTACMLSQPGDVILVAGKGHETVQVIGKEKIEFDDREMVMKYLNG